MLKASAYLLLFGIAGAIAVFAYHNAEVVEINYVVGTLELPMAIVLGVAFVVGSLVSALLFLPGYLRHSREIRQLNKALSNGRKELDNLRNMPLQDD